MVLSKIGRRQFLIASGATTGFAVAVPSPLRAKATPVRLVDLKVDYIDRPLGIESAKPRLSWRIESDRRNLHQSAYRILVASSQDVLRTGTADLWDSGKVNSRKSFGIEYAGRDLSSRLRCWWGVQIWDEAGVASEPSDISWWEMGLLDPQDWVARWLAVEDPIAKADRQAGLHWIWGTPFDKEESRKFRFTFQLSDEATNGKLFIARHGAMRLVGVWIDGVAVVDAGIATQRNEWLTLQRMSAGDHLIAIEVDTNNPYPLSADSSQPRGLAAFARLELQSGETIRIGSGSGWKTATEPSGDWRARRYDDMAWSAALPVRIEGYQPWPALPAMYLRRSFSVDKPVRSARLYATALGCYEARLNGRRVGDAVLTPEPSQYAKRVLYRVYDVTEMLRQGPNALGLTVGDGWYASFNSFSGCYTWDVPPRRVLAQLELRFADGSSQIVATGPDWRTAESPIRRSEIRVGEVYDARLDQPGWDSAAFDDLPWHGAEIIDTPSCRVVAQISPPIRATQILKPRAISQPKPGTYVVDFGRHFAGWCRLHVQGSRGTPIELRFSELLKPSGEVEQDWFSIGEPKRDIFILGGASTNEVFEPHFTYRGFRYVQVTGLTTAPTTASIEGILIQSDLQMTGRLRTDASLIEQIWRNTVRSQQSNFVGIPTDCPSREQLCYLGDAGVFWDAGTFTMDVCAFTSRQMDNAVDDQSADGAFPMVAPMPRHDSFFRVSGSPPGWGDGAIILPWVTWQRYGDLSIIQRNWDAMNRHVKYILDNNPEYLWKNKRGRDPGDWLAVDQVRIDDTATTPKELIGTAYWAHSAKLLAQMAQAIGRMQDAERLHLLFDRIRRAFNSAYVGSDGTVGNGSQTGYILALKFGLLPVAIRQAAADRLANDIRRRGVALSTGFLGTQFSLDVLADAGFTDLVYGLLLRTEHPSWGHMIHAGATTMWENWSGEIMVEDKIHQMSRNHYALGAVCGFLFRRMAGIDAAAPGFETIVVRPIFDPRIKRGGGDYDSIMGRISTDWVRTSDGGWTLDVTIPANTTARIHLPAPRTSRILEGRTEISRRSDIRIVQRSKHEAVLEVGSGTYRYRVNS